MNSSYKFGVPFHNIGLVLVQNISPKILSKTDASKRLLYPPMIFPTGRLDYENPSLETHSKWII